MTITLNQYNDAKPDHKNFNDNNLYDNYSDKKYDY